MFVIDFIYIKNLFVKFKKILHNTFIVNDEVILNNYLIFTQRLQDPLDVILYTSFFMLSHSYMAELFFVCIF